MIEPGIFLFILGGVFLAQAKNKRETGIPVIMMIIGISITIIEYIKGL